MEEKAEVKEVTVEVKCEGQEEEVKDSWADEEEDEVKDDWAAESEEEEDKEVPMETGRSPSERWRSG